MTGTAAKTRTNKYAADCATCSRRVPAEAGRLVKEDGAWLVFCADTAACAAAGPDAVKAREAQRAEECQINLFCAGPCTTPEEHEAYRAAQRSAPAPTVRPTRRRRSTSPRQGSAVRRGTTSRRRKACASGGNCSSTTGRDCGGYDCDAN